MSIDFLRVLVTAIVIFVVVYGLERTSIMKGASKVKRAVVTACTLFIVLFIINLLWT